jgi:hypothetical protein
VGFEPTGARSFAVISSHASANSDRIDDRFEFATKEALRSFHHDRSDLRGAREAKNLVGLRKLIAPEKWPWAEAHANSLVRYAADRRAEITRVSCSRQCRPGGC